MLLQFFKGIDVFQIKATIKGCKVKKAAASAMEALRRYQDIQTRPGVTACSVMKGKPSS